MKGKLDSPKEIIEKCIIEQRKLLSGFKGSKKTNLKKWREAQNPNQFAISLIGEPTLYRKLPELIKELRKRKITSFLVTNGLCPEMLLKLKKKKALPTQIYISLNSPNKEEYERWHKSKEKNAWKKFNKSLEVMKKLKGKTRNVLRMTLVKDKNMKNEEGYEKLILKASPDFVEVKGFISVGYARERLGYKTMPTHKEIRSFAKKLLIYLPKYKILDEKQKSKIVLLGKDKKRMRIKEI